MPSLCSESAREVSESQISLISQKFALLTPGDDTPQHSAASFIPSAQMENLFRQLLAEFRLREEREIQREAQREAQREEREAQREERETQRETQREAQREEREARREEREAQRTETFCATLATLTREVQRLSLFHTVPSTVGAPGGRLGSGSSSGGGGGGGGGDRTAPSSSPRSSGSSSPRSPQRNSSSHSFAALAALRAAFSAALSEGTVPDTSSLRVPFSAMELLPMGVPFAHRVACKGVAGESRDFVSNLEGATTMLLPAEAGKAGMSFFIPLSSSPEMLRAAHAYHGAALGCLAYPLAGLPAGLTLTVDKIQAASSDTAGAPIMLHASLSAQRRMPLMDFSNAVEAWGGKQVCLLSAAGGGGAPDCVQHGSSACDGEESTVEDLGAGDDCSPGGGGTVAPLPCSSARLRCLRASPPPLRQAAAPQAGSLAAAVWACVTIRERCACDFGPTLGQQVLVRMREIFFLFVARFQELSDR